MPASTMRSERLRLARGRSDGGDDLRAAHRSHGSGRGGRSRERGSAAPSRWPRASIRGLASIHARPLASRAARRRRARIAHFGGGFERGTVVAVRDDGRRVQVRGEGGELLEFVLSPATARFVSAGERAAARAWSCSATRLTRSGRLRRRGSARRSARAATSRTHARSAAARRRESARAARAGARSARRRSPSARPGARTAARPRAARRPRCVAARARRAGERLRVLAPRGRRQRAAQREHVAVGVGVVAARARAAARLAARAPAHAPTRRSALGGALELRAHVAGQRAWRDPATRPPARARRACACSRAPARCRSCRSPAGSVRRRSRGPTCRACRSSRCVSARRSDSRHSAICPGAWPGRSTTRKPATSSPSATRARDLHRPAVPGVAVHQAVHLAQRRTAALRDPRASSESRRCLRRPAPRRGGRARARRAPAPRRGGRCARGRARPGGCRRASRRRCASARVIVRAPASNSVTPPSSSIRYTLQRAGLALHDPHALGDELGVAGRTGARSGASWR